MMFWKVENSAFSSSEIQFFEDALARFTNIIRYSGDVHSYIDRGLCYLVIGLNTLHKETLIHALQDFYTVMYSEVSSTDDKLLAKNHIRMVMCAMPLLEYEGHHMYTTHTPPATAA